jgi:hypothetical protein
MIKIIYKPHNHFWTRLKPSQVKDYGHRIPQGSVGKKQKSHWILQEIGESGSSIPIENFLDFFPMDSSQFPVVSSEN